MSLRDIAEKDRKADHSLNRPPLKDMTSPPVLGDLIILLWQRLSDIQTQIERTVEEKYKAQLYLTMAAHARILADLLRDAGLNRDEQQDLAKLLSGIRRKARAKARRIIWRDSRRNKHLKL